MPLAVVTVPTPPHAAPTPKRTMACVTCTVSKGLGEAAAAGAKDTQLHAHSAGCSACAEYSQTGSCWVQKEGNFYEFLHLPGFEAWAQLQSS